MMAKKKRQKAWQESLALLEAGSEVEACLRGQPRQAKRLRPLLEAANALRRLAVPPPSPQAVERGRRQIMASVKWERQRLEHQQERKQERRPWFLARPAVVLATATLVAAVGVVAVSTDFWDAFRPGAQPTLAREVKGALAGLGDGSFTVVTDRGPVVLSFRRDLAAVTPDGQTIPLPSLAVGTRLRVEVEEEDGALSAVRVEVEEEEEGRATATPAPVGATTPAAAGSPTPTPIPTPAPAATPTPTAVEVEFEGTIVAMSGSELRVSTAFGTAVVRLTASTDVDGPLAVGVKVEVHATLLSDGSYMAREIDADDEGSSGSGG